MNKLPRGVRVFRGKLQINYAHNGTRYLDAAHDATGVRRSSSPNYPWRHTYASIGLTNGAEPAWLAKQLGHSLQMVHGVYATWIRTADTDVAA
jgi:integrase